jgi:hypothetical protein
LCSAHGKEVFYVAKRGGMSRKKNKKLWMQDKKASKYGNTYLI